MEDPAAPLRVLVVEDSADARESTALLLQLWGCDTRVAADGAAALDLCAAYRPNVILLDIGLPGMDGLELARRLRALPPGPEHPLLVSVSGFAAHEDRCRALEAGCDLAWAKPADLGELRRLVSSHRPRGMRQAMSNHRIAMQSAPPSTAGLQAEAP